MFIFVKGKFDFLQPPSCFSFISITHRKRNKNNNRTPLNIDDALRGNSITKAMTEEKGEKMVSFFSPVRKQQQHEGEEGRNISLNVYVPPSERKKTRGRVVQQRRRGNIGKEDKFPLFSFNCIYFDALIRRASFISLCLHLRLLSVYISHFLILFSPYGGTERRLLFIRRRKTGSCSHVWPCPRWFLCCFAWHLLLMPTTPFFSSHFPLDCFHRQQTNSKDGIRWFLLYIRTVSYRYQSRQLNFKEKKQLKNKKDFTFSWRVHH